MALLGVAACGESGSSSSGTGGAAGGAGGGAGMPGGTGGVAGEAGGDAAAGSAGAGGASGCVPGSKQCSGPTPQTCDGSGSWKSGTPCQFACVSGTCSGVCIPGTKQCSSDTPQSCDTSGQWQDAAPCPYGCDAGACKDVACKAGEFNCHGNQVQQCDPGPPAKWVPKSPALTCNPAANQTCNETTGSCDQLQTMATPSNQGACHVYGYWEVFSGGAFKSGSRVDSFGDQIYVDRGAELDVYQVTLEDTDGDGKLEPDQHPDNSLDVGPMEARTLTLVKSYSKASDGVPIGGELYAKADRLLMLGPTTDGTLSEWVFATKASSKVTSGAPAGLNTSFLGFGEADSRWYAGNFGSKGSGLLSWHAGAGEWVSEFVPASSISGLEVVVAPKTGEQYAYIAGTGFIDQYRRDPAGWTAVNRFGYKYDKYATGLGFGAFDHFWLTGGYTLVEIGGGDCTQYLK
ncbi:MAG: hypothetical protein HS104_18670 [Polyangiaceae bacterium]|nr:hypothetical protein [Polyangiaceae bacterium]MCL4755530.1 hypothetical protein [Myxococcales bacterium]